MNVTVNVLFGLKFFCCLKNCHVKKGREYISLIKSKTFSSHFLIKKASRNAFDGANYSNARVTSGAPIYKLVFHYQPVSSVGNKKLTSMVSGQTIMNLMSPRKSMHGGHEQLLPGWSFFKRRLNINNVDHLCSSAGGARFCMQSRLQTWMEPTMWKCR